MIAGLNVKFDLQNKTRQQQNKQNKYILMWTEIKIVSGFRQKHAKR